MTSPDKAQWRIELLRARRKVTPEAREREAAALTAHLAGIIPAGRTVCAYVPVGTEPGSLALLDELLAQGARVLLPVARHDDSDAPLPLRWGEYRPGHLVDARFGLREPEPPWSAPDGIAEAAVVLIPALAVDRTGVRLGRGAGFYDRTLGFADRDAKLIAVVRDEELVERLPAEPHDVRMTHALTPGFGMIALRE